MALELAVLKATRILQLASSTSLDRRSPEAEASLEKNLSIAVALLANRDVPGGSEFVRLTMLLSGDINTVVEAGMYGSNPFSRR